MIKFIQNIRIHSNSFFENPINNVNEKNLKIVTHSGVFHSDEVFSIALLLHFMIGEGQVEIVRTRDEVFIAQQQRSPLVYVLDLGNKLEPGWRNFDHHQVKEQVEDKAAVRLILDYLIDKQCLGKDEYGFLLESIIKFLSNWDLGLEQSRADYTQKPLPTVVSSFNRFDIDQERENWQFEKALCFAFEIINNEREAYLQLQIAKQGFSRHIALSSDTILFDDFNPQYAVLLKRCCSHIKYYIHPLDKNWVVKSCNSHQFPLPNVENDDNLVFAHKSRFLSIFKNKQAALNYLFPQEKQEQQVYKACY